MSSELSDREAGKGSLELTTLSPPGGAAMTALYELLMAVMRFN